MGTRPADLVVILAYLGLMLYLGLRGYRMSRSAADYLVAGRRLGYAMYVGSLAAVVLGGASTVGGAQLGYRYGISGAWMVTMIGLGIVALGVFLSTRLARLGVLTVSEMLEARYDRAARVVSAAIMAAYAAFIAVIQVIAMGTILSAMAGWPLVPSMLAGAFVVLAYTLSGGMWSVSLTDFVQFVLMTTGVFVVLVPAGLLAVGGPRALFARLPASYADPVAIGLDDIAGFFLLFFLGLLIGQDIWQRVFTARDETVARRGTILAGLYCVGYAVATTLVGMVAAVRFPDLADPQMAFATVAVALLPAGLSGVVLAASLSALMSTASGALLAAATLLANDVYGSLRPVPSDRGLLRASRWALFGVGVGVVAAAVWMGDVLRALDTAYTLLTGSLFVPIVAALFWKRANAAAALVSMAASGLVAVGAMAYWGIGTTPPIVAGLATSLASFVAVSLATAPTDAARLAAWTRLTEEGPENGGRR